LSTFLVVSGIFIKNYHLYTIFYPNVQKRLTMRPKCDPQEVANINAVRRNSLSAAILTSFEIQICTMSLSGPLLPKPDKMVLLDVLRCRLGYRHCTKFVKTNLESSFSASSVQYFFFYRHPELRKSNNKVASWIQELFTMKDWFLSQHKSLGSVL
jgi:hypothetical protein